MLPEMDIGDDVVVLYHLSQKILIKLIIFG